MTEKAFNEGFYYGCGFGFLVAFTLCGFGFFIYKYAHILYVMFNG